jgi:hypothetical protein
MAKIPRLLTILTLTVFLAGSSAAQDPSPLYVIDLSSFEEGSAYANGTVTFLSDHTLVAGVCPKTSCNLRTFDLSCGSPRQIAQMNGIDRYQGILRSSDGGVLLTGVVRGRKRGAVLVDEGLHTSRWIPKVPGFSASGEKIAKGEGRLLTHTTNLAAYFDHGAVRIQSIDGKLLGSFEVGGQHVPTISFIGQDRILVGEKEIRDFHGKVLRKFKEPGRALGEKTKASTDGSRLLFDSFTRRVGLAQTIMEDTLAVPTMGMRGDGYVPNGEVVRVTDTRSGKRCFEWYGKEDLLSPFMDHADIDPSGQLVAIMTRRNLAVFKLPDACTNQIKSRTASAR